MEKFDGVRVFWDGKKLYSKNMKVIINIPHNIIFPPIPFEGELW